MKALVILSGVLLIGACFFPWVFIESKGLTVSGIHTEGTNFGKPAFFHFLLVGLALLFLFINKGWSQKGAVFFSAFNMAWAIRNFIVISTCRMGDCPSKQPAIYFLIPCALLFLLGCLLWNSAKKEA